MTVLEEILKTILVAGAAIWVPMVIGAVAWAVRYVRRRGTRIATAPAGPRNDKREEIVYE